MEVKIDIEKKLTLVLGESEIEKIGSQGGRPLKLYKITIQEFIKLQEARTPGKKPKPKAEQQQVSGINDLLLARWSK